LKKVKLLLIVAIAAIAIAFVTTPAFAMRDMGAQNAAAATAEGGLLAGAATAASSAAGGTVKSLFSRSRRKGGRVIVERVTGTRALIAISYGAHNSGTLWFMTAAKFLSALSIVLENGEFQPNYLANILAVVVWVAAFGSAVSTLFLLLTKSDEKTDSVESMKAESARLTKSRFLGFVVFLIGLAVAYYLTL